MCYFSEISFRNVASFPQSDFVRLMPFLSRFRSSMKNTPFFVVSSDHEELVIFLITNTNL